MNTESSHSLSIDIQEDIQKEVSVKTEQIPTFIKIRDFSSNVFTPVKIKDLTQNGKKNMGYFGIIALTILIIIVGIDLYALLDENPIVIVNVLLPIIVSLLSVQKAIALGLHIIFNRFK